MMTSGREARDRLIVDRYLAGRSLRAVGAQFGLSGERVRQICEERGIATRTDLWGTNARRFDDERLLRDLAETGSVQQAAARQGMSHESAYAYIHRMRADGRAIPPYGRTRATKERRSA